MSVEIHEDNQPYDEINITPMLDLTYVLLVIFIIMTTASVQGVRVEPPRTVTAQTLAKPQTRAITVTREGNVFLDAYPVDMQQLEVRLAQYKVANPALPVVLKGDAEAQYDKVMQVLEICKRLDIVEIGLVTKRAGG
ncbi:MAG: biopolymer transporter ExbD [Pseudomonadales bacterium]|jgi:biopolymer transport protein ExbD|nr:biopolymer transporter ExbD [Pseudomonadales bacterium]MCP5332361.1 biopolymer transporter ExbD [Pseudomonadales bacterium]HMU90961.1 biopolymer transporter ExbD [Pseudomonadales bacterium]HMW16120.1 biopolymer transporter ExbD [Pseudomonadales bacterium]HMW83913.1 biopolymer transporter ExbD [Pseudomonadales bacterium]